MKKGVALFFTFIFIIIIFAIANEVFKIYKNYSSQNYAQIINQNSIFISNITNILKQIDINSSDDLKSILTSFPLFSRDGDFRGLVKVSIESNKIPINNYLKNNKINKNINNFLNLLFEKYEIIDPLFLKSIILDTLDIDDKERAGYSEIKLEDNYFPNGYINRDILKKIINYYYKKSEDKNVYKIPWDRLFTFFKTPAYCEFLNKEILNILGFDKNCEEIIEDNKQTLEKLNIISFNKAKPLIVKININYILNKNEENLKIFYDINKKKVIKIENSILY